MDRPKYLSNYLFDWETASIVIGGKSALDSRSFVKPMFEPSQVQGFLRGYGFDPSDPVTRAELFGNFQEALQFIRRYFLKENNPAGLDLKVPNFFYTITDVEDLFLIATGVNSQPIEDKLWAEVILKVMHTILHTDKDLRSNYFNVIQTQVFDQFYKYLHRDRESDELHYLNEASGEMIPLYDFQTKSKKARDSVIIKLLHKAENVAEELFDRVGVRFVTRTRFDSLRILRFLMEKNIVIPHNVKPSRSMNTLFDFENFKDNYPRLIRESIRNHYNEQEFLEKADELIHASSMKDSKDSDGKNKHTSNRYLSLQFTCRQLIKYRNPFMKEFSQLRTLAKEDRENPLAEKIMSLDTSLISREIRFFYPFEIQIMDYDAFVNNTEGEASHEEYKKAQVKSAMKRVFTPLIRHHGIVVQ